VAQAKRAAAPPELAHARAARVQACLERLVQRDGAQLAAVHGAQYLDLPDARETELLGHVTRYQLDHRVARQRRLVAPDEVEIGAARVLPRRRLQLRQGALVHGVRRGDDAAL